jgi:hypothetical protein
MVAGGAHREPPMIDGQSSVSTTQRQVGSRDKDGLAAAHVAATSRRRRQVRDWGAVRHVLPVSVGGAGNLGVIRTTPKLSSPRSLEISPATTVHMTTQTCHRRSRHSDRAAKSHRTCRLEYSRPKTRHRARHWVRRDSGCSVLAWVSGVGVGVPAIVGSRLIHPKPRSMDIHGLTHPRRRPFREMGESHQHSIGSRFHRGLCCRNSCWIRTLGGRANGLWMASPWCPSNCLTGDWLRSRRGSNIWSRRTILVVTLSQQ